jgi:Rrf2 family protein
MLTLNRKSDYALIALSHLGRSPDKVTSAREIAERYEIPVPLLMNILKQLNREGIVASVRGAQGGYRLAVAPDDLSVRRVLSAVEGPVRLVRCAAPSGGDSDDEPACERMGWCPVRGSALKLHAKLAEFLDRVSLAEIIESPEPARLPASASAEG